VSVISFATVIKVAAHHFATKFHFVQTAASSPARVQSVLQTSISQATTTFQETHQTFQATDMI